jgi:hypothetical protein
VQATFSGVPKTKKGTLHTCMSLAQPANDCTNRAGAAHKKKAGRSMISTTGGGYCIKHETCGRESGLGEPQLPKCQKQKPEE